MGRCLAGWPSGPGCRVAQRAHGKRERSLHRHDHWRPCAPATGRTPGWPLVGHWELLATRSAGTVTSLAAAGNDVLAATPAGLRRSTDGGHTWTVLGGPLVPAIELVVASPAFT